MVFKLIGNIISKILIVSLLGLLIFSVAFFGVTDVFKSGGNQEVASVGGESISATELAEASRYNVNQARARFGDISESMIQNIQRNELNAIIRRKIIDIELDRIGIRASEEYIKDDIRKNELFMSGDGKFKKEKFLDFLQAIGKTEKAYVNDLKYSLSSALLLSSFAAQPSITSFQIEAIAKYEGEKRKAKLLIIPESIIKDSDLETPSESDLITYYDKNKYKYTSSELRDIKYFAFNREFIEKNANISDSDAQNEYDLTKDDYIIGEKRELLQIIIGDHESAQKAYEQLSKGGDFYKVAQEIADLSKKDTEFGSSTEQELFESGLLSSDVIDSIFTAEKNAITAPSESSFGWHIFKIISIEPPRQQEFAEVKESIKKRLKEDFIADGLYELATKIEDSFAGGNGFDEVAKEFDIEVKIVTDINKLGRDSDGKIPERMPQYGDFIKSAFKRDIDVDSAVIQSDDGYSYYSSVVTKITPSKPRALDEVHGMVLKDWKIVQRGKKLAEKASEIAKDIIANSEGDAVQYLAKKAQELGLETASDEFERNGYDQNTIPMLVRKSLFRIEKGQATGARLRNDGVYVIAAVEDIIFADQEISERIQKSNLNRQFVEDILSQYLQYLQYRYPVEFTSGAF